MDGFTFAATIRDSTISGNTARPRAAASTTRTPAAPLLFQRTADHQQPGRRQRRRRLLLRSGRGDHLRGLDDLGQHRRRRRRRHLRLRHRRRRLHHQPHHDLRQHRRRRRRRRLLLRAGRPGGHREQHDLGQPRRPAGSGGGLFLYNLYDPFTIRNSTVANNTAGGSGGGIYLYSGTATLADTIVGDNSIVAAPRAARTEGIARAPTTWRTETAASSTPATP